MAGTRRGPEGSGRRIRAERRPQERRRWLAARMEAARNDRERVSLASEYLRSVMADPAVSDDHARQAADQAVKFLTALADQLQATTTPRGER